MNREDYAYKALMVRLRTEFEQQRREIILPSREGLLCRIIFSGGRLAVSVRADVRERMLNYLRIINISEEIRRPDFYKEVLAVMRLDCEGFELEPSERYVEPEKKYNCFHTLEYTCDLDSFHPVKESVPITVVHSEDRELLEEGFSDTMYCIYVEGNKVSESYYRRNGGEFNGTCAMQVGTCKEYEGRGFGRTVAGAATEEVCANGGLALWVCQVENLPSRRIAESLGYEFLGGELKILSK